METVEFVVLNEKSCPVGKVFDKELDARLFLEDVFVENRNHNYYLYRKDSAGSAEIGRRINSNRFGGPMSR